MVKILRKYNKYVLVVGMSLLMIAFLIPSGIKEVNDPARRSYAHLGGKKVSAKEFTKVQQEYNALERMSPSLMKGVLGVDNADHWLLLGKQAEDGGFVGEAGDGADWTLLEAITARALAEQQFGQYAQFALEQANIANQLMEQAKAMVPRMKADALRVGITERDFNRALAKARGVYRMIEAFQRAARFSDRRALVEKKTRLDAVFTDCAVIPAERIAATVVAPTEEEIRAHFEKYRPVKTGTGEFGIGYTLPARMKMEWLTLDRPAIEAAVKIDPVEVNKRWRTNRSKYPGEFAAERENVEREARAEKVTEIMDTADRTVRAELKKTAGKLDSAGGYKVLPADWAGKRPKLEAIAQAVVETVKTATGFEMPLPPVTVKAANWLTQPEIETLPQIGAASVRSGAKSVPFPQVAFLVKELRSDALATDFGLQVGLTSSDIFAIDNEGRRYYFTVLDVRPESAADTLDEVKDKVIADIKDIRAYETLLSKAETFTSAAATGGIDAVTKAVDEQFPRPADAPALADNATVKTLKNVVFLKDEIVHGDPRLNVANLREAVRGAAAKMDPAKPGADVPASDRTLSRGLPGSLSLAVVQLTQNRPMTAEINRQAGERTISQLQAVEFQDAIAKQTGSRPFSLKELTARMDYKPDRGANPEEVPEEPEPSADKAADKSTGKGG